jgi:hypothetical protein
MQPTGLSGIGSRIGKEAKVSRHSSAADVMAGHSDKTTGELGAFTLARFV